jgi:hypothetical protein
MELCPPLGTVLVIISRLASATKRPVFQPFLSMKLTSEPSVGPLSSPTVLVLTSRLASAIKRPAFQSFLFMNLTSESIMEPLSSSTVLTDLQIGLRYKEAVFQPFLSINLHYKKACLS